MKKWIKVLLCLGIGHTSFSQTWYEGTISTLKFGLKVNTTTQTIQVFIPEQGLFEQPLKNIVFQGDSLRGELKAVGVLLSGKMDSVSFEGQWKQNGFPTQLHLKRVTALSFFKRPQMPKAPFPYRDEKVKFTNNDGSITFGGTLTLPESKGPFKTVILISGSGQQDRDESLFGHKTFWVIADHLTRQGIAVLRVDDRGVGETTGSMGTSAEYAQDVLDAIRYLKTRKQVHPKKIGLIGHSEGGVIAPLAAVQSKDVAFIVFLAGLGMSGKDLLLRQSDDILKQMGSNETYRNQVRSLNEIIYSTVARLPLEGDIKDSLQTTFDQWVKTQPESVLGQLGYKTEQGRKNFQKQIEAMNSSWYRYFIKYDPQPVLSKITIPVLALNGSKDIQVASQPNLEGFKRGLTTAGNKQFETVELPGLNHLFQKCTKCTSSEYGLLEETFSVEALELMANWLKKR